MCFGGKPGGHTHLWENIVDPLNTMPFQEKQPKQPKQVSPYVTPTPAPLNYTETANTSTSQPATTPDATPTTRKRVSSYVPSWTPTTSNLGNDTPGAGVN